MTEDELYELVQSGDSETIHRRILDPINGVGAPPDPRFLRVAQDKFLGRQVGPGVQVDGEYTDLYEDPRFQPALKAGDRDLAAQYPNAPYEDRLDVLGQIGRKKFGTPTSRWCIDEQARRRGLPPPDVGAYEMEVEERTEFDSEHDAGIAEGIEQRRKLCAGTLVSEIRRQLPGMVSTETDET